MNSSSSFVVYCDIICCGLVLVDVYGYFKFFKCMNSVRGIIEGWVFDKVY